MSPASAQPVSPVLQVAVPVPLQAPPAVGPLVLQNREFHPGEEGEAFLSLGYSLAHAEVSVPVYVIRSKKPGPRLLVVAGIHGDEINGVAIVRRLLGLKSSLKLACGDLIAIPVANIPAFHFRSRYLPDRRDLNRLFPGSLNGSLGSRLARLLVDEVIRKATHIIDLHSGVENRANYPHVRMDSGQEGAEEIARAFGAAVVLDSEPPEGSLRSLQSLLGIPIINYEGGSAKVLDDHTILHGVRGVLGVMAHLHMLPANKRKQLKLTRPLITRRSQWIRSPIGGLLSAVVEPGQIVAAGAVLGRIMDPFSSQIQLIIATQPGVVIGLARQAFTDAGDAVIHLASIPSGESAERALGEANAFMDQWPGGGEDYD